MNLIKHYNSIMEFVCFYYAPDSPSSLSESVRFGNFPFSYNSIPYSFFFQCSSSKSQSNFFLIKSSKFSFKMSEYFPFIALNIKIFFYKLYFLFTMIFLFTISLVKNFICIIYHSHFSDSWNR